MAFMSSSGQLFALCAGNQHDARGPAGASPGQPSHEQRRASAAGEPRNGRPHLQHLAGRAVGACDARECFPGTETLMPLHSRQSFCPVGQNSTCFCTGYALSNYRGFAHLGTLDMAQSGSFDDMA